jgi:perosamine synthetase
MVLARHSRSASGLTSNFLQIPAPLFLPRLPVLGWDTFAGEKDSALPCVLDHPHRVYTQSGRAAIALAIATLDIGRGDAVLVPTFHCPTMISPIVAAGAEPLFFPIDNLGAPRLDVLSVQDLRLVRAMLVAHYFGLPQTMSTVRKFCDERGIALIEDCAHAMFGKVEGRPIGGWGDFAIASLTKFFPVTDGGCLVLASGMAMPRSLGRRSSISEVRSVANSIESGARHHRLRGLNTPVNAFFAIANRMRHRRNSRSAIASTDPPNEFLRSGSMETPLQSVTAPVDASKWAKWIARSAHRERIVMARRRNYLYLAGELGSIPGAVPLLPQLPDDAAPYVFPIWAEQPEASYQAIREAGVPIFRWDQIWPGTPEIRGDFGVQWAKHIFQLGCHQDLSIDDLSRMVDRLRQLVAGVAAAGQGRIAPAMAAVK